MTGTGWAVSVRADGNFQEQRPIDALKEALNSSELHNFDSLLPSKGKIMRGSRIEYPKSRACLFRSPFFPFPKLYRHPITFTTNVI
jgi:hypothetical protein